jgi:hypothetical protein
MVEGKYECGKLVYRGETGAGWYWTSICMAELIGVYSKIYQLYAPTCLSLVVTCFGSLYVPSLGTL